MEQILENAYIYGIKIDDQLVYIGKTNRSIDSRLEEHAIYNGHNQELENAMQENNFEFVIIYKSHNAISNEDLEQIERVLIENIKPKYNILGVTKPYTLYKTKKDYLYKKGRHYIGLTDVEIDGMINLNKFNISNYIYGLTNIVTHVLYEQGIIEKNTKEALYQAFGEPNDFSDTVWHNYGDKGFCFKSSLIGTEDFGIRPFNINEMEKGLKNVYENNEQPKKFIGGIIIFFWRDDIVEFLSEYLKNFEYFYKEEDYVSAFGLMQEYNNPRVKKIIAAQNDLEQRMSLLFRPSYYINDTGSCFIVPAKEQKEEYFSLE